MRHTILIATLSSVAASVLTTVVISGSLFGANTASSANTPGEAVAAVSPGGVESILQGDINCDGVVDTHDTLGGLRFLGDLDVPQTEPCPDVGTVIPAGEGVPGPQGPQGEEGPQGEQGAQGNQGPPGIGGLVLVLEDGPRDSSFSKFAQKLCPDGTEVLGGGYTIQGEGALNIAVEVDAPIFPLFGWAVGAYEHTATNDDWGITVFAICANVAE